jgi:hypothetical protein
MRPLRIRCRGALAVGSAAAAALLLTSMTAAASTATATITAGSLGLVGTPGNVTFSDTLNGQDQTVTAALPLDVSDATGSGTGWNLTATSTTFTSGAHTLGAPLVESTPSDACDSNATHCTTATNSIAYPYTMPAGTTAPTATKLFDAGLNSGMGNQTVTPTFSLALNSGTTYAGTYASVWTISLVSGP